MTTHIAPLMTRLNALLGPEGKVQVDDYVYAVPFVETETEIFLKTIIPSRKATQQYRRNP